MPEVWRVEYHVLDRDGEAVDWLSSRSEAIAAAREIGGSVEKVTEYLSERETVFDGPDPEEDA